MTSPALNYLRPSVTCPHCGRRPRLRLASGERDAAMQQPPLAVKLTYQCHSCRNVYAITARAYQEAA